MNLAGKLLSSIQEQRPTVIVIGDGMNDVYVEGRVEDKCQEDCPKFVETARVYVPGGAANAARSIKNWGAKLLYYGHATGDGPQRTRYMVDGRCVFRWDFEGSGRANTEAIRMAALAQLNSPNYSAVLLSDYDKGMLTPEFIKVVVAICQGRGVRCVADMKRAPHLYEGCILKCNSAYQHLHNQELAARVFDVDPGQRLVVTDGGANPITWDGDGPIGLGYTLPRLECVNHVGAGDCFAAHLTLALACGLGLPDASRLAHSAGRVYVRHSYNRPPEPAEVVADLSSAR